MTTRVDERDESNRQLMKKLLVATAIMFGFGFALVPFYEAICEATGIRNVFQPDAVAAQNTQVDATREVSVEFDANTQRLPWTFRPLQASVAVHPGEVAQVMYEVRNTLDRPVTGQAVPSFGPQPGEVRKMPVVFVIDPKLPADVNTVTLSYTFFEVDGARGAPG
jgi:cytochrome c oxidase assembly protein subunit 11